MCTSIVSNRKKTIIGWNLDLLGMEHRVTVKDAGVYIEVYDAKEGWLPLFGANSRGDFVGMPTCWPFDGRSDPADPGTDVIHLDIDLLLQKKTFAEVKRIAEDGPIWSVPGVTFMPSLSDREGNVLHIIPGQGFKYYEKPEYAVLTNFSPFKMDSETHPWMGWDRYNTAVRMLEEAEDDFDVPDCFRILQAAAQEVCPTVVTMVFVPQERKVWWCENREWDKVNVKVLSPG